MQFMLLLTESDEAFAKREHPEHASTYWGAWNDYIGAMAKAGIIVRGDGLLGPHTATTVRVRNGRREIQDGPYANIREQLGGYFVIDVPNLEAAIDWAAQSPSATYASVEVRPVLPPMNPPS